VSAAEPTASTLPAFDESISLGLLGMSFTESSEIGAPQSFARATLVRPFEGPKKWDDATHKGIEEGSALHFRLQRLVDLTRLDDWDNDDAPAIPPSLWARAFRICGAVKKIGPELPLPFPAPCGDGTIHLAWVVAEQKVLLEIGARSLTLVCNGSSRNSSESISAFEKAPALVVSSLPKR
jgi:hypothetical protein